MALKTVFIAMVLVYFIANATAARELLIAARLEASGGLAECWNELNELKSCTNEVVLFFVNGKADIGPDCCRAIEIITRHCWPAMLTSLGFTSQEGNVLRGYCDAASASAPPPGPAAPPMV